MQAFPPVPDVADAPDLLADGHLWIQEQVDGALLRFAVAESGLIRFGDRDRVFGAGEVPLQFRHAVDHVRRTVDREALDAARTADVTFIGVATHRHAIDYDWDRTPSFLGVEVRSVARGLLPPDEGTRVFERIGLAPVNSFERERRARDFDPATYAFPESAWYDGPPAGAVLRDKRGARAVLDHPADPAGQPPAEVDPATLVDRYATADWLGRVADRLDRRGDPVDVDSLLAELVDVVVRREYARLAGPDGSPDLESVRGDLAARARSFLEAEWHT